MERILVIGGTGRLGQAVVLALAQAGYRVRVITRQAELPKALLRENVEAFHGDFSQKDVLKAAIKDMQAIYMNLPEAGNPKASFIPERDGVENILQLVSKEVLLLKLSAIEAEENPHYHELSLKFRAEEKIRASGNPYIIFRPTWFMESFPLALVQKNYILYAGKQPSPLYWIAAQDFAAQVVTAIEKRALLANRIFNVQGLEALSFAEAAQRYAAAQPENLKILRLPLALLRFAGLWNAEQHSIYELMAHFDRRQERFVSEDTWQLLGKPRIRFDEFASTWAKKEIN